MTIRPATIKDVEKIQRLNTQIFEEINTSCDDDYSPAFAESKAGKDYFKAALKRTDGCLFVAEDKGNLIGYVNGGTKDISYRKSKYFEIENLGIVPEYRGQLLGSQLLETITNWAKTHGIQKIYVNSYFQNTPAIYFYKKHGYQEIDVSFEKAI